MTILKNSSSQSASSDSQFLQPRSQALSSKNGREPGNEATVFECCDTACDRSSLYSWVETARSKEKGVLGIKMPHIRQPHAWTLSKLITQPYITCVQSAY